MGYYRSVTIDHTKCGSGNSSNFPALIRISDATLKTVGNGGHVENSNGYDILFYADSGKTTPLKWEMDKYDGTNGEVLAWVKIPTLSASVDTVIYCFYGDATISTFQSVVADVWDSSFQAVYHLGTGSALSLVDSTTNGRTLTQVGSPAAVAGQIYGGANGWGTGDYLERASAAGLNGGAALTAECWVKPTVATADQTMMSKWDYNTLGSWIMQTGNASAAANNVHCFIADSDTDTGGNNIWTTDNPLADNTFKHVAMVFDGSGSNNTDKVKIYVNGVARATSATGTIPTTINGGTATLKLGRIGGAIIPRVLTGVLDECRISNAVRNVSWLLSTFNCTSSPSTFVTIGSEQSAGGGGGGFQAAWARNANTMIDLGN